MWSKRAALMSAGPAGTHRQSTRAAGWGHLRRPSEMALPVGFGGGEQGAEVGVQCALKVDVPG